jgi:hypothetical protein
MDVVFYGLDEDAGLTEAVRDEIVLLAEHRRVTLTRNFITVEYRPQSEALDPSRVEIDLLYLPMEGPSSALVPIDVFHACVRGYHAWCASQGHKPRACVLQDLG